MFRKPVWTFSLLLLCAMRQTDAQATTRGDSRSRYGTWSATNGTQTLMGTWTAVPDTGNVTVVGAWTLTDSQGKAVISGGWSAAKSTERWYGNWRAVAAGQSGEYSGTWTSSVDLKASVGFADLFEKAVTTVINGSWLAGNRSGAWAIRAAPADRSSTPWNSGSYHP